MKYFLLIICCLPATSHSLSAQGIRGRVTDSISGKPIAYAAIQYGPNEGVITNDEGYFRLQPDIGSWTALQISCLGYQNKSIPLNALKPDGNTIVLSEAVVVLNEVLLSNKDPDANAIMAKVRARINENYRSRWQTHHIFSRATEYVDFETLDLQISKATGVPRDDLAQTNRDLDSLARVVRQNRTIHFTDFLGDLYLKDENTAKLMVEKATSLIDAEKDFSVEKIQEKAQGIVLHYLDTAESYKLKSGMFKIEDSLKLDQDGMKEENPNEYQVNTLRTKVQDLLKTSFFSGESFLSEFLDPRAYSFQFQKATFFNGALIYVLSYRPNRSRSKYEGAIFVDGNDYAIVKVNYRYADGKRGKKINLKLLLGIKFIADTDRGTILFKKGTGGYYEPSYVQRTTGNYFFVNRPVKFIENSAARKKVTANFTIAGNSRSKEELLLTRSAVMDIGAYNAMNEAEKVPVIQLQHYDETLWQGDEILLPLEEMRQFNVLQ